MSAIGDKGETLAGDTRDRRAVWRAYPDRYELISPISKEHPKPLIAPAFAMPNYIFGLPPSIPGEYKVHFVHNADGKDDDINYYYRPIGNMHFYLRMIAKIAHAYTVAEVGLKNFRPYLVPLILGDTAEVSNYVGGMLELPPCGNVLHAIVLVRRSARIMRSGLVVGIELYIVVLRLFSNLGGPLYIVVSGEPTQAIVRGR